MSRRQQQVAAVRSELLKRTPVPEPSEDASRTDLPLQQRLSVSYTPLPAPSALSPQAAPAFAPTMFDTARAPLDPSPVHSHPTATRHGATHTPAHPRPTTRTGLPADGDPSRPLFIPDGTTSLYGALGPSLSHAITTLTPPRLTSWSLEEVQTFCIKCSQYEGYCRLSHTAPEPIWTLLGERQLVGASQFVKRTLRREIAPHGSVPTDGLRAWDASVREALFTYANSATEHADISIPMLLEEIKKAVKWSTSELRFMAAFSTFESDWELVKRRFRIDRFLQSNKKLERRIIKVLVDNLQPPAWSHRIATDLELRDEYELVAFFDMLADSARDYRGYASSVSHAPADIATDSTSRIATARPIVSSIAATITAAPSLVAPPANSAHAGLLVRSVPPPHPCKYCGGPHWNNACEERTG